MLSIDFNNNSITYNCQNLCGKINIEIKDYFKKLIFITYLSEKCSICENIQLKDFISNKDIFNYCYDCKKIFCKVCWKTKICKHTNFIKLNEMNSKCLIHHNNDYFCYCFVDKKNLCNECLTIKR